MSTATIPPPSATHTAVAAPASAPSQLAPLPPVPAIPLGRQGVQLGTYEDLFRFAKSVALSGFAPKGMEKPESVLVAIQLGLELGITPMSALQNIAVINGRPGIFGDAALALARSSGLVDSYTQKIEGEGEKRQAVVATKRKGAAEAIVTTFSVADAKAAGLWGKPGPWSQYPERMLLFRARGFNLRDNFGDVLKGLRTVEELGDIPAERNVTPRSTRREIAPPTPVDVPAAPAAEPATASADAATADESELFLRKEGA